MILILYYLIIPFFAAFLVMKFIKKYGRHEIPPDIQRLYAEQPLQKGWYRALRSDRAGKKIIGDCETKVEAVDTAYRGKEEAQATGERATFSVLNDRGEALEEIAS